MAAYLVGTRGTPVHAVGLGLSVACRTRSGSWPSPSSSSAPAGVLPPDVVVRVAPVIAAASIVAIGGWMLFGEVRRRRGRVPCRRRRAATSTRTTTAQDARTSARRTTRTTTSTPTTTRTHAPTPADHGEHSHGGVRHSHLPPAGATISLAEPVRPRAGRRADPLDSALLILLGSIAAGRPAFGLILVVAFGLGMAAVMSGVGLAMVFARGRLDRCRGATRASVASRRACRSWRAVAGLRARDRT